MLIRAETYSERFFIRQCSLKAAVSASIATPFGATVRINQRPSL